MIMWDKPSLHVANKSSRVEIRRSGRGVITAWLCRLLPNRTAPTISEVGSRKLNLAGNFCTTFQSCSGPNTSLLNSTSAWAATQELTAGEASITRVSFEFSTSNTFFFLHIFSSFLMFLFLNLTFCLFIICGYFSRLFLKWDIFFYDFIFTHTDCRDCWDDRCFGLWKMFCTCHYNQYSPVIRINYS